MSQLVDEEKLEALAFERSKTWSNFLKRCEQNEDGVEFGLGEIEQLFADEDEESYIDGEEAVEEDVEEDINNVSACMTKAELTIMLCSGDNKDIVNQTLPIVEEHVRKWKEAGLDRILNTFDAQKIEQHVGGWMRRHNSAYGDKTLLAIAASPEKRLKSHTNYSCSSSDSETESMHSVDTARYIRDSRKHTVTAISNSCNSSRNPMASIKLYCTLPKKRDELRAKYDCDEEQEHRHHMEALLYRRDRRKRERELMYHNSPRHNPYAHPIASSSSQPRRRKQLRKRRDNSPVYNTSHTCSSSSSEDEYTPGRCNCNGCIRRAFSKTSIHPYCPYRSYHSRTHIRSNRHRRHHHHSSRHVELDTRFTHSMTHYQRTACKLQRQHAFDKDLRARRDEIDCNCCIKKRICSKVLHIASSSTEEWVIENNRCPIDPTPSKSRSKPDEEELPTTSQKQAKPLVTFSADIVPPQSISKASATKGANKLKSQPKAELSMATSSKEAEQSPIEAKEKPKAIAKENTNDKSNEKSELSEATSSKEVREKPKAIAKTNTKDKSSELSEATSSKEVKEKPKAITKTNTKDKSSGKTVDNKKQTITKAADKNNKKKKTAEKNEEMEQDDDKSELDDDDTDDEFERQLKLALALSEKSYIIKQLEAAASQDSPPQLPEQSTFFNNQSVACNSTALINTTAKAKQLKSQTATTATKNVCSPDGEADCTVVTSTTSCEAPAPAAAPATPTKATTAILISDSESESESQIQRPKLTKNGILLYAPGKDQSQSLQSISSNSSAGNITITEDTLKPIIGTRRALKFLSYNMGNCSFDGRYPVYYRPPARLEALLRSKGRAMDLEELSSSSDDDIFVKLDNRYGEIVTVREDDEDSD